MSLRALPQDLCTPRHRQVPHPPRLAGTRGTGSKTRLSGFSELSGISDLFAVAERQIRQKRRLQHWRHAHQLSLCINHDDWLEKLNRFAAHRRTLHSGRVVRGTRSPSTAQLQDFLIQLVAIRAELNQLDDPVGVLNINAVLLYLAKYSRGANVSASRPPVF